MLKCNLIICCMLMDYYHVTNIHRDIAKMLIRKLMYCTKIMKSVTINTSQLHS